LKNLDPANRTPRPWARFGLHGKMVLAAAFTIVGSVAAVSSVLTWQQAHILNDQVERATLQLRQGMVERGQLLAASTTRSMENAIAGFNFNFVAETVRGLATEDNQLSWALVAREDGTVVVRSDPDLGDDTARSNSAGPAIANAQASDLVILSHAINVGGERWGTLRLAFDPADINQQALATKHRGRVLRARTMTLGFMFAFAIAGLGLTASAALSRRLLKPVSKLAREASAISRGDLEQEIRMTDSPDEIGKLALQFENMRLALKGHISELVVARQQADTAYREEKRLRAQVEEHSRLLERRVRERTAELEASNERLTEYDRLKTEFLSNVSHELRSPVAAILSAARIINRYGDTKPESAERFSGVIMEESSRLSRLINDLLDLAKIESGRVEWRSHRIADPLGILSHVYATFRPLYEERNISLTIDATGPLPAIDGDRDRLIQVLTNLCSNSMKFTPAGGSVVMGATAETINGESTLLLTITDSGPGIPESQVDQVFERFHQVQATTYGNKPKGTGLGLAICREVVEHHGGNIRVELPDNGGTRMVVALPAVGQYPATAEPPVLH